MKKIFQNIFVSILYFTPIGYLLKLISLETGQSTPGVFVQMRENEPVIVVVKKNPSTQDRVRWFINGLVLLAEAYYVINFEIGGDLGGTFAFVALIFGVVNSITAVFPKIDWNGKKSNFLLLTIIILSLFFTVAFVTLKHYFLEK